MRRPIGLGAKADVVFLQELIDAGTLRTVIGRRHTLDEIADAHRYAETGPRLATSRC